jgi:hypothetical protein
MAAAVDSVTCVRGPFHVDGFSNFSGDQTTRIILMTSNLGTTLPSDVTVTINGIPLTVEAVGSFNNVPNGIPNFNGSYIIVSLGALRTQPPLTGALPLMVSVGTASSNVAFISIASP